jgi:hypothetical protein
MDCMSRRTFAPALLLSALLAFAPAPAAAVEADAADVDRLLEVMDMSSMMTDMMKQMSDAQEAMVMQAFGSELSADERERMEAFMARTRARLDERLAWPVLEPIFRDVYAQVFTREEIEAMTEFYASPTGASILRKSPQATALSMQAMQPLMQELMLALQSDLKAEAGATP